MDRQELVSVCLSFPGAEEDFQADWQAWRYRIGKKMFALIGQYQEREIVSLKCEPFDALELRDMYTDIFPGYYLNKAHWNSIYLDGGVPDELMRKLIFNSYHLVFNSLTKKLKQEIESK